MSDKPAWMEKATILIVGKNRVKKMWRNLFNTIEYLRGN